MSDSTRKVALVTGALGGIGSAVCRSLLAANYRIIALLSARNGDREEQWLRQEGFDSNRIRFVAADLKDHETAQAAICAALDAEGRIDLLVNNAGITRDVQFKKMSFEEWSAVLDTNLKSLFTVTQPVFIRMLQQQSGRIVNISSVNGLKGQFGQTNYSAAKAGMIGFTKALAAEGARYGICVNAVAPGYTATPMVAAIREEVADTIKATIPMQRFATPEEIAAAVLYLAGSAAAYITGETLSINGGLYMH